MLDQHTLARCEGLEEGYPQNMCGLLLFQGGEKPNTKIFPTPHLYQANPWFLTLKVEIINSVHIQNAD